MDMDELKVAVIGAGPWGSNHIRVYQQIDGVELKLVCDKDKKLLEKYKNIKTTEDYRDILKDEEIKAVSVCTPASTHFKIAKDCIEAGKHVLVEKPLTLDSKQAENLIRIADKNKVVLATGQIFRFEPTIIRLKEEIKTGTFGKIYYISLSRMGLKRPREDCGVMFNYAIHDLDIMCDVLNQNMPEEITAVATHSLGRRYEDLGIVIVKFRNGILGYSQVSWLPPKKIRDFWVIGEKRSAFVDTMNFELQIYDSGIVPKQDDFGTFQLVTRSGKVKTINVERDEPLKKELEHFIDCILTGKKPINSGEIGVNAVRMIEHTLKSAKTGKKMRFL
jgi:predicted dehydrogenase